MTGGDDLLNVKAPVNEYKFTSGQLVKKSLSFENDDPININSEPKIIITPIVSERKKSVEMTPRKEPAKPDSLKEVRKESIITSSPLRKPSEAREDSVSIFDDKTLQSQNTLSEKTSGNKIISFFGCLKKKKVTRRANSLLQKEENVQLIADKLKKKHMESVRAKARAVKATSGRLLAIMAKQTIRSRDPLVAKIFQTALVIK